MRCKKCNAIIPYRAIMCNSCYNRTGYRYPSRMYCPEDMYGNIVTMLPIDKKKNAARNTYIHKLPEYRELDSLRQIDKERSKKAFLFSILFALALLSTFLLTMLFSLLSEEFAIFGFMIGVALSVTTCVFFAIYKQPVGTIEAKRRIIHMHNTKTTYYASDNVIGYSVLDHTKTDSEGHTSHYFAYYETDKRNIKSIGYDAKFAEYVLILYKPVYVHYSMNPTYEFRLQDVFDDGVLSDALQCSLPPKNIPF